MYTTLSELIYVCQHYQIILFHILEVVKTFMGFWGVDTFEKEVENKTNIISYSVYALFSANVGRLDKI